jgi:hypothetical protein
MKTIYKNFAFFFIFSFLCNFLKAQTSPVIPTLKASIVNDKIVLTWDDISERDTYDPISQENDFEGYKLYRAYDPWINNCEWLYDSIGTKMFRKPIYQCDLTNGISGYFEIGINGFSYYLGNDSGLYHQFIDSTFQKEQNIYYVLVAYDHGYLPFGYQPRECNFYFGLWEDEIIVKSTNYAFISLITQIYDQGKNDYSFDLFQNYPNPFNPTTTIVYNLKYNSEVIIRVYNLKGQIVKVLENSYKNAGKYQITFDGSGLSSGVYFYRIDAGNFSKTKSMLQLK